jgi:hypothetical protein
METPLTPMPRSDRAVRAESGLPIRIAMHCDTDLPSRTAHFEDEGPATPPLRRSVARCAEAHRLAKRRTERFLLWDLRPGFQICSLGLERESNPRHSVDETDALPV